MEASSREEAFRPFRIVAQDPTFKDKNGRVVTAEVMIPAEALSRGPLGYRVHVIDYDASTRRYHSPKDYDDIPTPADPYVDERSVASQRTLRTDFQFHQQNVYVIAMRTLAKFESALGRRVDWGFLGHQLKIAPHAFSEANAFYSRDDRGLLFGYFQGREGPVFTCLSHDIIAHETSHAVLDGLRSRYLYPSSYDQAAFHEGFSDVVAILSVFAIPEVIHTVLDKVTNTDGLIAKTDLSLTKLKSSKLFQIAEQMGKELEGFRGGALRQSLNIKLNESWKSKPEFELPHRRGEILVAAILHSFIRVWRARMAPALTRGFIDQERVVEVATSTADYLLTMAIRALDYTPPSHIVFEDYLAAILTADAEVQPTDREGDYRQHLKAVFGEWGIHSPVPGNGRWLRERLEELSYERVNHGPLRENPNEVFRFVWENRKALRLTSQAYTEVVSVRPVVRISPEGMPLRETVAEVVQWLNVRSSELRRECEREFTSKRVSTATRKDYERLLAVLEEEYSDEFTFGLTGGTTLVFDDFGFVKYSVGTRVDNYLAQLDRLKHLHDTGDLSRRIRPTERISQLHLDSTRDSGEYAGEVWS